MAALGSHKYINAERDLQITLELRDDACHAGYRDRLNPGQVREAELVGKKNRINTPCLKGFNVLTSALVNPGQTLLLVIVHIPR